MQSHHYFATTDARNLLICILMGLKLPQLKFITDLLNSELNFTNETIFAVTSLQKLFQSQN